jgi:hypothetical protein
MKNPKGTFRGKMKEDQNINELGAGPATAVLIFLRRASRT